MEDEEREERKRGNVSWAAPDHLGYPHPAVIPADFQSPYSSDDLQSTRAWPEFPSGSPLCLRSFRGPPSPAIRFRLITDLRVHGNFVLVDVANPLVHPSIVPRRPGPDLLLSICLSVVFFFFLVSVQYQTELGALSPGPLRIATASS